ncbi:hypothetical protein CYMTET_15014 [Cymbomonas tetramitiformis]|uniref:Uncharacterized protein n=1 Tax=Cymbomonas tetramitiformis TaxID=36881 RepID=A0AAE0L9F5_9CHLO|nr:hypothetical protein CYMTET_15014 [Cymbomonas tetramitiformis]
MESPQGNKLVAKEMVFGHDQQVSMKQSQPSQRLGGGERLSMCNQFIITKDGQWIPNSNPSRLDPVPEYNFPAAKPEVVIKSNSSSTPKKSRVDALDSFMTGSRSSSRGSNASTARSSMALMGLDGNKRAASREARPDSQASRPDSRSSKPRPSSRENVQPALPKIDLSNSSQLQQARMRQLGLAS